MKTIFNLFSSNKNNNEQSVEQEELQHDKNYQQTVEDIGEKLVELYNAILEQETIEELNNAIEDLNSYCHENESYMQYLKCNNSLSYYASYTNLFKSLGIELFVDSAFLNNHNFFNEEIEGYLNNIAHSILKSFNKTLTNESITNIAIVSCCVKAIYPSLNNGLYHFSITLFNLWSRETFSNYLSKFSVDSNLSITHKLSIYEMINTCNREFYFYNVVKTYETHLNPILFIVLSAAIKETLNEEGFGISLTSKQMRILNSICRDSVVYFRTTAILDDYDRYKLNNAKVPFIKYLSEVVKENGYSYFSTSHRDYKDYITYKDASTDLNYYIFSLSKLFNTKPNKEGKLVIDSLE